MTARSRRHSPHRWFSYARLASNHGHEIGSSTTWCLRLGRAHVNIERSVGVYGFRSTVSHSIRWWWA